MKNLEDNLEQGGGSLQPVSFFGPVSKRNLPLVSIIVPCRNEEKHIARCLKSILENDYPKERMEILVLDGMSEDHTGAIVADYAQRYPQLRLMNNPTRTIPTAMNRGIKQAQGEVVMKVDAHSTYPEDFISNSVRFLEQY